MKKTMYAIRCWSARHGWETVNEIDGDGHILVGADAWESVKTYTTQRAAKWDIYLHESRYGKQNRLELFKCDSRGNAVATDHPVESMQWIPVEKCLPSAGDPILFTVWLSNASHVHMGHLHPTSPNDLVYECSCCGEPWRPGRVTHWSPIVLPNGKRAV